MPIEADTANSDGGGRRSPFRGLKCPECRFALDGTEEWRCPECGVAFDPNYLGSRTFIENRRRPWMRALFLLSLAGLVVAVVAEFIWGHWLFQCFTVVLLAWALFAWAGAFARH
ncbi:MAG: hypothetical protein ACF8PN_09730 [Phycisphaerales bacterium]